MSPKSVEISLVSNNQEYSRYLIASNHPAVKFVENSNPSHHPYCVVLIHLEESLENITQKLIEVYEKCRQSKTKLAVSLIFDSIPDQEKISYFQKHLLDLGGQNPLHRLTISWEIYQDSEFGSSFYFNRLIDQAISEHFLPISTKGKVTHRPLHLDDFIQGLTKSLFLNHTEGKTFWLLGDPIKDLELGYLLKRSLQDLIPDLNLDASQSNDCYSPEIDNLSLSTEVKLNWRPEKDLVSFLEQYPKLYHSRQTIRHLAPQHEKIPLLGKLSEHFYHLKPRLQVGQYQIRDVFRKTLGVLLVIFSSLYLATFLIFASASYLAFGQIEKTLFSLRQGDLRASADSASKVSLLANISEQTYFSIKPLVRLADLKTDGEVNNVFLFVRYLNNTLESLRQTYNLADNIYLSLFDSKPKVAIQDLTLALKANLSSVYENLNQIETLVSSGRLPNIVVKKIKESGELSKLPQIESQLYQASRLVDLLPIIFGNQQEQKVGIVLQNNRQLRSSGGLIKEVVVLSLSQGKVVKTEKFSATSIDQKLDGQLKAPEILSQLTGSKNWVLKDMGYSPDYQQNAELITWYIEKTIGQRIDYLLSVNYSFLGRLISSEKTINIPYGNFSEVDLDSLSGPAGDEIEGQIIDHYLSRLKSADLKLSLLARSILEEVESGNLLLWSKNPISEKIIASQSYGGVLTQNHSCPAQITTSEECQKFISLINFSNYSATISGSKIKEIAHHINLKPFEIEHLYQVRYSSGSYKGVIQIALTGDTKFVTALLKDQNLLLSVNQQKLTNNLSLFQIPVSFSLDSDTDLTLSFVSSLPAVTSSGVYSFTEIRQSGQSTPGVGLIVSFPETLQPTLTTAEVTAKPGQLMYRYPTKTSTFSFNLEKFKD